ncbi:hypothetical protein DFH11DRAFT_1266963 [Phellopilus nigrolimitatus]|nr:hypothetical protein DFH11DRAFT_1266963 [Phellopilus nigrolimitatus]
MTKNNNNVDAELVVREVTDGVWTFSKPFARGGLIPFGGRSTAIQLESGGVWVLASTPLTPRTREKLSELGDVAFIVSPDAVHDLYLAEFQEAYPAAKLIGVEALLRKENLKGLTFGGVYGRDPADAAFGFEHEIAACYFSGFKNKDVAFLHARSRTLVEADLLFNLPAHEQYGGHAPWFPFAAALSPYTALHRRIVWALGEDKDAMRRGARTVAGWDFDRVIPCHGVRTRFAVSFEKRRRISDFLRSRIGQDTIETGGKRAWEAAYKLYLQ